MKYQVDLSTRISIEANGEITDEGIDKILGQIESTIQKMGGSAKGTEIKITSMGRGVVRKSEGYSKNEDEYLKESIRRKGL